MLTTPYLLDAREPLPITGPDNLTLWHWLTDAGDERGWAYNPAWVPDAMHRFVRGGHATPELARRALADVVARSQGTGEKQS